jgi:transcriptional regulator with XRE-family HTH domain
VSYGVAKDGWEVRWREATGRQRARRFRSGDMPHVAERITTSPGSLSRLENGEHGAPADEVIPKLTAIIDIDAGELRKEPKRQSNLQPEAHCDCRRSSERCRKDRRQSPVENTI